eukprot:3614211-Heterocapsa_arctica.AAC.1
MSLELSAAGRQAGRQAVPIGPQDACAATLTRALHLPAEPLPAWGEVADSIRGTSSNTSYRPASASSLSGGDLSL